MILIKAISNILILKVMQQQNSSYEKTLFMPFKVINHVYITYINHDDYFETKQGSVKVILDQNIYLFSSSNLYLVVQFFKELFRS